MAPQDGRDARHDYMVSCIFRGHEAYREFSTASISGVHTYYYSDAKDDYTVVDTCTGQELGE